MSEKREPLENDDVQIGSEALGRIFRDVIEKTRLTPAQTAPVQPVPDEERESKRK